MDMQEAFRVFASSSEPSRSRALNLLDKITTNILENPNEEKFRSLNADKVVPKIAEAKGALELLLNVGFTLQEGRYSLPMHVLIAPLEELRDALRLLREYNPVEQSQQGGSSQQQVVDDDKEAKRKEALRIFQENNASVNAEAAKKKQERELLKKKMELARKEKEANTVVQASVANNLSFGMSLKKFEPPKEQKGG